MSLPRYESYKDIGVEWLGEVPSHWDLHRLRHVAQLNPSKSEARHLNVEAELTFLPMEAIGERGEIDLSRTRPASEVQTGYSYFANGDIAFAKVTPCFENGKGALMRGLTYGVGFGTTELTVVRPNQKFSTEFLWWFLCSTSFRLPAASEMTGAGGLKRVPDEYVNDCLIPWPSIQEQNSIAAFLQRETARIDRLVAAQERLITLLKEKRQAVISHAVTKGLDPSAPMKDSGVEWLGQVPAHWKVGPMKRSWDVTDCKHVTAEFVDDGFPLASIRESQGRYVDLALAKHTTKAFYDLLIEGGRKPQPGDLIFTRNATVGEVAQVATWHPPFALGQDVCLLSKRDQTSSTEFLWYVMRSASTQRQLDELMIGSTFKRINVEEIRGLAVPIPPVEEQAAIAIHLERMTQTYDSSLRVAADGIALLQERRAALISAAVTGKIDVRGHVQPVDLA